MIGDRDHAGTGMDWPGGGEARVGAGLLSWIQIGSMAQLNITRIDKHLKLNSDSVIIYDSSYHVSFSMYSVNATDQGTLIRLGCYLQMKISFKPSLVMTGRAEMFAPHYEISPPLSFVMPSL